MAFLYISYYTRGSAFGPANVQEMFRRIVARKDVYLAILRTVFFIFLVLKLEVS